MKFTRTFLTGLLGLTLGWCSVGFSQSYAPDSVVGNLLTVTAAGGSAPFVSSGSYKLFTSANGTNYFITGRAGSGFGFGSYNYTKLGTNTGVLAFLDSKSGPGISLSLSFTASGLGTYSLAGTSGSQTGTFAISNYLAAAPSELFLPSLTNNQFQIYLSGRNGFVYSIETSSNLAGWASWTNATITDLTTPLTADAGGGSRFFRARMQATAFAPDSLTNKTFDQTILDGLAPLATNGSRQWVSSTNGNAYQIIGLAGTTNSSGTYAYTKTGPDSGVISYVDSLAGNVTEQLLFTSANAGCFYGTNSSGVESGTFAVTDGPDLFFGNIRFIPDAARSHSVYFAANGTPATLSVTNAGGWIWTLSFPADALLTPRTITMIPSASVDSSASFLSVFNGVQLEPNGLVFCNGVTLTVTPPAPLGSTPGFIMAGEDGSDVYFVQNTNVAGAYSTVLYHFSSGGIGDGLGKTLQDAKDITVAALERVFDDMIHESLEDLDNRFPTPPPPPDYGANCNGADDAALDDYLETILNPPLSKRETILEGLGQQLTQLTGISSFETDADNLIKSALTIYEQYEVNYVLGYSGPAKALAKANLVTSVTSKLESHGLPVPTRWEPAIEGAIEGAKNYYAQRVTIGDYSMLNTATRIGDFQGRLIGDSGSSDSFRKYLAGIMTFTLTMDLVWTSSHGKMEAQGDVNITADPQTFALSGTGSIANNSGTFDICTFVQNPFNESVQMTDWDMQCKGHTLALELSPPATTPAILTCPTGPPTTYPVSPLLDTTGIAFAAYGKSGRFSFNVPVGDGETTTDQTFMGDSGSGPVTLHFTLKHTPQFGVGL